MKSSLFSAVLALLVVVLATGYWTGCTDNPSSEAIPAASPDAIAAPAPHVGEKSFDDMLAEIAVMVPGFGGMYIAEDGAMEVVMSDRTLEAGVENAIRAVLPMENVSYTGVRIVDGKYAFNQLKDWNDAVYKSVLAMDGAVFTDINERANKLVVGISDASLRNSVEAAYKAAGVPTGALVIEMTGPVVQELGLRRRPLVGGLQIAMSSGGFCTLGFIGNRAGVRGFVTNSHCSGIQGGVQGIVYHQPVISGTTNRVGLETADPVYFAGGPCPAGRVCRRSDAAFARVPHPLGPVTGSLLGRIARTAEASVAWNGTSLWTILGKQNPTFMGETVKRVGRTQGTRTGVVNGTCMNVGVASTTITMLCQGRANYISGPGDSGSPVFRVVNAGSFTVALNGIHWGSFVAGGAAGDRIFSTINFVDSELTTITVN